MNSFVVILYDKKTPKGTVLSSDAQSLTESVCVILITNIDLSLNTTSILYESDLDLFTLNQDKGNILRSGLALV